MEASAMESALEWALWLSLAAAAVSFAALVTVWAYGKVMR